MDALFGRETLTEVNNQKSELTGWTNYFEKKKKTSLDFLSL